MPTSISDLYFDICAAIILIALLFSVISRKMMHDRSGRTFIILTAVTLMAAVFDIWAVLLNFAAASGSSVPLGLHFYTHTAYLLFHNLTIFVYLFFIISIVDIWHLLVRKVLLLILLLVPIAVVIFSLILNYSTGIIFYFTDGYQYTRGPFMYVLYVCSTLNILMSMAIVVRYRKSLKGAGLWMLLSMPPLEMIAVAIQFLIPSMLVEIFANTVALYLLTTTVHRPEELLDSVTRLGKYDAYVSDMRRGFENKKSVTVILINISNFAAINNILTYDTVNDLLKNISSELLAINKECRIHADIYYLEDGNFALVINRFNCAQAASAAEKINLFLKRHISVHHLELNLIPYVCMVKCPEDIKDLKTLIRFGAGIPDKTGFSGEVLYAADLMRTHAFALNNDLDEIIDKAIANQCFEVYYQPIYSVGKKRFLSAEALLRLKDERHGLISPDLFIPAAERSGAIHKIGALMFDEVCRFIAGEEFAKLGLEYIEVNLSVIQCMSPDLSGQILQTLQKYGVAPDKINLEITETAASYAQNIMTANIDRLSKEGLKFSLDDYGTGYSNLTRIASLPFGIIKLDKSFTSLDANPRMRIILQNTIQMIKAMDMDIVVEGVETEEMLHTFTGLKCDYIQGFYFSRPIPKPDFIRFILERQADCQ